MGFLGTPTSSPKSLALSREHTGELAKHSKEPDSVKLVGKARGNETTMLVLITAVMALTTIKVSMVGVVRLEITHFLLSTAMQQQKQTIRARSTWMLLTVGIIINIIATVITRVITNNANNSIARN